MLAVECTLIGTHSRKEPFTNMWVLWHSLFTGRMPPVVEVALHKLYRRCCCRYACTAAHSALNSAPLEQLSVATRPGRSRLVHALGRPLLVHVLVWVGRPVARARARRCWRSSVGQVAPIGAADIVTLSLSGTLGFPFTLRLSSGLSSRCLSSACMVLANSRHVRCTTRVLLELPPYRHCCRVPHARRLQLQKPCLLCLHVDRAHLRGKRNLIKVLLSRPLAQQLLQHAALIRGPLHRLEVLATGLVAVRCAIGDCYGEKNVNGHLHLTVASTDVSYPTFACFDLQRHLKYLTWHILKS